MTDARVVRLIPLLDQATLEAVTEWNSRPAASACVILPRRPHHQLPCSRSSSYERKALEDR